VADQSAAVPGHGPALACRSGFQLACWSAHLLFLPGSTAAVIAAELSEGHIRAVPNRASDERPGNGFEKGRRRRTTEAARRQGHPLLFTTEPEEQGAARGPEQRAGGGAPPRAGGIAPPGDGRRGRPAQRPDRDRSRGTAGPRRRPPCPAPALRRGEGSRAQRLQAGAAIALAPAGRQLPAPARPGSALGREPWPRRGRAGPGPRRVPFGPGRADLARAPRDWTPGASAGGRARGASAHRPVARLPRTRRPGRGGGRSRRRPGDTPFRPRPFRP
jgi:hypothetical protein